MIQATKEILHLDGNGGVANVNSNYPGPLPESAWDMGNSNRYYVYILKYA